MAIKTTADAYFQLDYDFLMGNVETPLTGENEGIPAINLEDLQTQQQHATDNNNDHNP